MRKRKDINKLNHLTIKDIEDILSHIKNNINSKVGGVRLYGCYLTKKLIDEIINQVIDLEEEQDLIKYIECDCNSGRFKTKTMNGKSYRVCFYCDAVV